MRTPRHRPRSNPGFTLLEVVIAVGIMAAISGMVFGIARSSLSLGNTIVTSQNEESEKDALLEMLDGLFTGMPGNARLELVADDKGTHLLTDLTLQQVPAAFTWGAADRIAKAVRLRTVKRRSGYLDLVLQYFEEEILEGSESAATPTAGEPEPFAEIVLLRDLSFYEMRVLDGRSGEWQFEWDLPGQLPLLVEFAFTVGSRGEEVRRMFWLPPRQNPDSITRMMGMTQPPAGEGDGPPTESPADGEGRANPVETPRITPEGP
jgi:prepilin-type N-terminal cleavage/methylation domain-containing protein